MLSNDNLSAKSSTFTKQREATTSTGDIYLSFRSSVRYNSKTLLSRLLRSSEHLFYVLHFLRRQVNQVDVFKWLTIGRGDPRTKEAPETVKTRRRRKGWCKKTFEWDLWQRNF